MHIFPVGTLGGFIGNLSEVSVPFVTSCMF